MGRVQDLLLITALTTVRADGVTVDLFDDVVAGLRDDLDDAIELGDDVRFLPSPLLDAAAVVGDGAPRDDVEVAAGVLETPDGDVLLVVGASDPERPGAPIGSGDEHAVLDMTFLGDRLTPGDPLVVEHAFGQTLPPDDPASEAGLDLLDVFAARVAAGAVDYLAVEVAGGTEPAVLTQPARVVDGSTEVETPFKAQPMTDGFKSGARSGLRGGLGGVRKFFQRFGGGALDSLDLIRRNLLPDPPPPGPTPPRRPRCRFVGKGGGIIGLSKCLTGHGDPHLATMDGLRYSYQGVGEYVALRGDGLEVQIRTAASDPDVSQIVAVAVAVDGHVVEVVQVPEPGVLLDGAPVDVEDLRGEGVEAGTLRLSQYLGRFAITTDEGIVVSVGRNGGRVDPDLVAMSLDVAVPMDDPRTWAGFAGDGDGDPDNDLTTREGTALPVPPGSDDLRRFGDSWRLIDDESLFTYGPGESTATFTDLEAPRTVRDVASLDPATRRFAASWCELAGVTDPVVLEQCTLDLAVTGDPGYLSGALWADAVARDRLDPPAAAGAEPPGQDLQLPDEVVWATRLPGELMEPLADQLVANDDVALVRTREGEVVTLHAVDPSDGTHRWSASVAPQPDPVLTQDGTVVAVAVDGGAPSLIALDAATGHELARIDGAAADVDELTVVADDGVVLVGATEIMALEATTLADRWRFTPQAVSEAAAAVAGDLVVAGSLRNSLVVQHLDGRTGDVIGQLALPGVASSSTQLTVLDDRRVAVLSRTWDVINGLALTGGDPELLWTATVGHDDRLLSPPLRLVAADGLLVGWTSSLDGPSISALDGDDGRVVWAHTPQGFALSEGGIAPIAGGVAVRPSSVWLELVDRRGRLVASIPTPTRDGREPVNVGPALDLAGGQRLLVAGPAGRGAGSYVAALDLP